MLDLSTAVLCDFAQVRDRLLFVASGAVSRLYRRELPSPLGLMVGLVIEVPLEDAGVEHTMRADIVNRHGEVLATLDNTFRVGNEGLFPHEVQQVPLVLSITGVRARTWGTHQVRLNLDGELVRALTLYVVPAADTAQAGPAATTPTSRPTPAPVPAEPDEGDEDAADRAALEDSPDALEISEASEDDRSESVPEFKFDDEPAADEPAETHDEGAGDDSSELASLWDDAGQADGGGTDTDAEDASESTPAADETEPAPSDSVWQDDASDSPDASDEDPSDGDEDGDDSQGRRGWLRR